MDGKWFWMVHKLHSWCTHLSNRSFLGQGHSRWYGPQKPNKIQDSDSVNGGESETFDINLRSITIRLNARMDSLGWILAFGYVYKFLMHSSLFVPENKTRTKSNNINISRCSEESKLCQNFDVLVGFPNSRENSYAYLNVDKNWTIFCVWQVDH